MALRAQRRLNEAGALLSRSFERLSSGLRINRASDDAAGLAIADTLRVNARLSQVALKNVNDGLSAINIAESTLQQQSAILVRLKELAEQSANGTFSFAQRRALNSEYQQLLQELGRIGSAARFNGQSLLARYTSNSPATLSLQVGTTSNSNSIISVSTGNSVQFSGTLNGAAGSLWSGSDYTIDVFDNLDFATNVAGGIEGLTQTYSNTATFSVVDSDGNQRTVAMVVIEAEAGLIAVGFADIASDGSADLINGGYSVFETDSSGQVTEGQVVNLLFASGESASIALDLRSLRVANGGVSDSAIDFTNVLTAAGARTALEMLDVRGTELSQMIGEYGATASRLDIITALLKSSTENTLAAESRIRDVDVASESAALVAAQIKQQVVASILSQANQAPALLLDLL
ncbi:MAG: flagellin [Bdellovibrionota bacterium]|nr:MAG: flagellin [Bdellovibrionota bacterium]